MLGLPEAVSAQHRIEVGSPVRGLEVSGVNLNLI